MGSWVVWCSRLGDGLEQWNVCIMRRVRKLASVEFGVTRGDEKGIK